MSIWDFKKSSAEFSFAYKKRACNTKNSRDVETSMHSHWFALLFLAVKSEINPVDQLQSQELTLMAFKSDFL